MKIKPALAHVRFRVEVHFQVANVLRRSVFANSVKAPNQDMKPPMLSNAVINFGDGLATLGFSAYQSLAPHEYLCCVGSKGTLRGAGNLCNLTELELTTQKGTAKIPLKGQWFPDGFRGTLGEFLRSIEEDREPSIRTCLVIPSFSA